MLSRAVTKKRRGRRLFTALAVTSIVAGTFLAAGTALAVHEFQFQLDGDTTNTAFSPPHPPATTPGTDWDGIFNVAQANGVETVSNNATNVGSGKTFDTANFVRDFESGAGCTLSSTSTTFCTADDTTYATGSKDTLGVGNGGWQCNHDNNVNSKIDIMNAYVAEYANPANGHKIFYFGVERNVSNGTNDVGVWFLQGRANCTSPSGPSTSPGATRTATRWWYLSTRPAAA